MAAGLAHRAGHLLALRYLLGLAECAYIPAAVGLLADPPAPSHRGRAIAIHTMGLNVGAILGATLSGFLGEHFGWRAPFVILGMLGIGLTLIAAYALRGRGRSRQAQTSLARADDGPSLL